MKCKVTFGMKVMSNAYIPRMYSKTFVLSLELFYHKHEDYFFFFFKELSTLKIQHFASTELSLAIKYYRPLFPQPVAVKHRQHLDYVTFLCWASLPASLCLLSLPGSWLALPHLLCQASHACKGGEWCFRQT